MAQAPAHRDVIRRQLDAVLQNLQRLVKLLLSLIVAGQLIKLRQRLLQPSLAKVDLGQLGVGDAVVGD
jgi:hypothetical protein